LMVTRVLLVHVCAGFCSVSAIGIHERAGEFWWICAGCKVRVRKEIGKVRM
jgi:hypothetical protein